MDLLAELIAAGMLGVAVGVLIYWITHRQKVGSYEALAKGIIHKAEVEILSLKKVHDLALKQKQLEQQQEIEQAWHGERSKIQREEERLKQREDKLENRLNLMEKKLADVEKREASLSARKTQLEEEQQRIAKIENTLVNNLERISGITATEAKEILLERMTNDIKAEAANRIRRILKEAEENAEREARTIIATAMNRLAADCVSSSTVNTVSIPSDEMKGRIIGREGRNIRALEQATGINFLIDDTPGAVVLSGFDPVRLQVAKTALVDLIADGRIHPTRIEESVEKAKLHIKKQIKQHGEDAALRAGLMNLHPEIITLLGKLKYRFSYGQNVLEHSLQVCHLMGIMATELGLDVRLAKRIGLLHDMGKAVTHEVEGTHALIGYEFALKYGESKEVANGIGCHHNEIPATTIEGSLCSVADTLSASLPGARNEAIEEYIKRLSQLEEISMQFPGVEKAYAMQAGREIRIMVLPDKVDDDELLTLTRTLTKRIEKELSYPGKIRITAIREKRVVEYAM